MCCNAGDNCIALSISFFFKAIHIIFSDFCEETAIMPVTPSINSVWKNKSQYKVWQLGGNHGYEKRLRG